MKMLLLLREKSTQDSKKSFHTKLGHLRNSDHDTLSSSNSVAVSSHRKMASWPDRV